MKILPFFIIGASIVVGGFMYWNTQTSPVDTTNKQTQIFVVGKGQGVKAIAKNLEDAKLIKNQNTFYLQVKLLGIENTIQAGSFRLSPSLSSEEIAKALTKGSIDVWVTIPEGKRADEIADILEKNVKTYQPSWREKLIQQEGYLFPDTYLLPQDADIDQIITIMKKNFMQKYATLSNKKPNMTQREIVTIASLIEREAKHDEDRRLIASVIYNRLDLGMALDIDATVQYAIGNSKKWWPTLTDAARNIAPSSAYNTYTHTGLPPTPIANPGLKTLQAAMDPSDTPYLFYITDKNGINRYGKTNAEHERNIQKYGL